MVYRKDDTISTVKFDDTWEGIDDELISTPYGLHLKSYVESEEYKEFLEKIKLQKLRQKREVECFSVINRCQFWYDTLTEEQRAELKFWYKAWLDVTETKAIPEKPDWLK